LFWGNRQKQKSCPGTLREPLLQKPPIGKDGETEEVDYAIAACSQHVCRKSACVLLHPAFGTPAKGDYYYTLLARLVNRIPKNSSSQIPACSLPSSRFPFIIIDSPTTKNFGKKAEKIEKCEDLNPPSGINSQMCIFRFDFQDFPALGPRQRNTLHETCPEHSRRMRNTNSVVG
jgi:hypothetical protein